MVKGPKYTSKEDNDSTIRKTPRTTKRNHKRVFKEIEKNVLVPGETKSYFRKEKVGPRSRRQEPTKHYIWPREERWGERQTQT